MITVNNFYMNEENKKENVISAFIKILRLNDEQIQVIDTQQESMLKCNQDLCSCTVAR